MKLNIFIVMVLGAAFSSYASANTGSFSPYEAECAPQFNPTNSSLSVKILRQTKVAEVELKSLGKEPRTAEFQTQRDGSFTDGSQMVYQGEDFRLAVSIETRADGAPEYRATLDAIVNETPLHVENLLCSIKMFVPHPAVTGSN